MKRRQLLLAAMGVAGAAAARSPAFVPYVERFEVKAFVDALVAEQHLNRAWIERVLASGRYSARAERLMTPSLSPPPRDWQRYRAHILDDARLDHAADYWLVHRGALQRAEEEYGVPPQIILAIIGVESRFGRVTGNLRTLDVLLTLAFDYPRRAEYYRGELINFLLLGHEGRLDVLSQMGSFAGAIGLPQFMPGSIRRFAVDFDGDQRIDLARSPADAIGSVANYLHRHGWQRHRPVMFKAIANEAIAEQLGGGIIAERSWADLAELGVRIDGYLPPEVAVLLLDLPYRRDDGSEAFEYRVGTVNLATILHYNRSYFYGAAVAEFAAELRSRLGGEDSSDRAAAQ